MDDPLMSNVSEQRRPWTRPELKKIGRISDVAKTGPGPNQCSGKGCTTKS